MSDTRQPTPAEDRSGPGDAASGFRLRLHSPPTDSRPTGTAPVIATMSDPRPSDEGDADRGATGGAGPTELCELRFVGAATEETLEAAGIDAPTILEKSISFVGLVDAGVDPGVAARLRREYSLPWSNESTTGARLRRRASHVRGLRDDERSWIEASWDGAGDDPAAALPDGSGSATEAERAWRERSRGVTDIFPDLAGVQQSEEHAMMEQTIDPDSLTVPELEASLERVADPDALVNVYEAERAGDARTTALEAIERRLTAVGVDPDALATPEKRENEAFIGGLSERVPEAARSVDLSALSESDLADRLSAYIEDGRARAAEAAALAEDRLDDLDAEDWEHVSFALLLGVTAFSALIAVLVALRGGLGIPAGGASLFVITATVGLMAVPLRWWEAPGAEAMSMVTAALGLLSPVLVAAGVAGRLEAGAAIVVLPIAFLLGVGLAAATYVRRNEP